MQEILHVRSRRVNVADAANAVRTAADLVAEVLPVTSHDALEACSLVEAHASLGSRDALHAAVMKNSQIHMLGSVDRDFDVISDLKRIEPAHALALSMDRLDIDNFHPTIHQLGSIQTWTPGWLWRDLEVAHCFA